MIELEGEDLVTVYLPDTYHEPGAYATNFAGERITNIVQSTQPVGLSENEPGLYHVEYTVTNDAGVSANHARMVLVDGQ